MLDDIKTHQDDIKTLTRQRADLCEDIDPELQALAAETDALLAAANEMRADREKQLGNAERLEKAIEQVKGQMAEVKEVREKVEGDRVHTCREKIEMLQVS